jgi:hypothetical protein
MQVAPLRDETRPGGSFWNIVVLCVRKGLNILSSGFDCRRFDVRSGVGMVRFDQADVVEEKLVAPGRAELTALLEKDANFRSSAIVVIGQNLDDDRHLVWSVSFEDDMFHDELVAADARTFLDCAFDHVSRDAGFARFFDDSRESRICGGLSPAEFCSDHDFFHKLPDELTFFEPGDFSFGVEPLSTHPADVSVARLLYKKRAVF